MDWLTTTLRENPELALFLTLALGFVFGRARLGSFRLGNVVGTLLAGVLVACAGAGTVTAALRAIQDEAGSKAPALGYTVPYAIGNILLTAWGPVVVLLTR